MLREGMEESYETFEEELGPSRADSLPQKPVRQIRRPEMYATRKVREEMAPQQPRAEPKTLPREPSFPRTTTLPKALSSQNLAQIERPWENVTLNRCLFMAITILVLTSGFQRLHETMRGRGPSEEDEEVELTVRRPGALRHRGQPAEPETTLWEVMLWWLPDLDDEDEEDEEDDDEDGGVKRGKSKRGAPARASKGLRNKPLPDKKLLKQREGKVKDKRAKKAKDDEYKEKKERDKSEELDEEAGDEDAEDRDEEAVPKKTKKMVEKKKTLKG
ncbi:junctional sarcoplasmic reticulum protein 1 isoform X1 [Labrus mixtus]|uniref:junctional sarcoplasmic reticulum protein 1 isoform X1 n=2 Tax=Labrus mixtus TaxID=508554 RepID=UPI0029C0E24F|nr:junctional sarcoplasmic reticulum protein 1 isoform X1 [Labrus mixtus]